jgi:hypothetical protein
MLAIAGVVLFASYGHSGASVRAVVSRQSSASSIPSATASSNISQCYQGVLPSNSTSTIIFNDTQEWNSGSWAPSTFKIGTFNFMTNRPQSSSARTYLWPEMFINDTNSRGQVQSVEVTNFGSFHGQSWPPDMSLEQSFFGGNATVQWFFLCDGHSVFLAATTHVTSSQAWTHG